MSSRIVSRVASFAAVVLLACSFTLSGWAGQSSSSSSSNPASSNPDSTNPDPSSAGQEKIEKQAKGKGAQSSSSSPVFAQEKEPSLVDPNGPAISLVDSETLFTMSVALNACGYDEGLDESDAIRQRVRDEVKRALDASEDARARRDEVCQFITGHRMTGTNRDISQYISLALYLTPPPALETSVELPEMPPDSTQVVEILPLVRDFAKSIDLHGIWVTSRHGYDDAVSHLHDSLTQMILTTNFYLKMPTSTYDGRRFLVVVEPLLSPKTIHARIYGSDYVVIVSPVNNQIRMTDVRHTYLHYLIEPLLYQRATAMDRFLPFLKDVREAPLEYVYRSDIVALTVECLIKAVEARTMDTGIANFVAPKDAKRSDFATIEHDRGVVQQKQEQIRLVRVRHESAQGFVMVPYFYEQMTQFEKDPASLKDTIGELVYGMDVDHEEHRARQVTFDEVADQDVLRRSAPRRLTGLDLAEVRLSAGDYATASALARQSLTVAIKGEVADVGRANFILARTAILTGHPQDAIAGFQKAVASAKETRILAWSHIYLGRILDLDCKRDEALSEYKSALAVRDGQQDTRLAAERGVKAAYAVQGHSCEVDASEDEGPDGKEIDPKTAKPPVSGLTTAPR